MVTIPAPSLARGGRADLDGEPLRLILLSAREEGEKVLFDCAHNEQQLQELPVSSSTDRAELLALLAAERAAVLAA